MANPRRYTNEVRSYAVEPAEGQLPSVTAPCSAPRGHSWVRSYAPSQVSSNPFLTGKWLIYVQCRYVEYCWSRVRDATEAGTLGIAAKVKTHFGMENDPNRFHSPSDHVVCVFSADLLDLEDVARVLRRLATIDAIRSGPKAYKPDIATRCGLREVTIYSSSPPYENVRFHDDELHALDALLAYHDVQPDYSGLLAGPAQFRDAKQKISDALLRVRGQARARSLTPGPSPSPRERGDRLLASDADQVGVRE